MKDGDIYIGDGVYVSYDGYALYLKTQRLHEEHWIAIEPEVWARLITAREYFLKFPKETSSGTQA